MTSVVRPALQEMIDKILPILRDTVVKGTNNSFAVVGPYGCGKSLVRPLEQSSSIGPIGEFSQPQWWLQRSHGCLSTTAVLTSGSHAQAVSKALQQIQKEAQAERGPEKAFTVHLSGALHSDKAQALKFVARKLCEDSGMPFVNTATVQENEIFLRQVLAHMGRHAHPFLACHKRLN